MSDGSKISWRGGIGGGGGGGIDWQIPSDTSARGIVYVCVGGVSPLYTVYCTVYGGRIQLQDKGMCAILYRMQLST